MRFVSASDDARAQRCSSRLHRVRPFLLWFRMRSACRPRSTMTTKLYSTTTPIYVHFILIMGRITQRQPRGRTTARLQNFSLFHAKSSEAAATSSNGYRKRTRRFHSKMSYQTQLQFLGIDSAHKIVAIDVHPHLPWVVGANDAGVVRVWDYVTRKPVHKFSISDLDTKEKDTNAMLATLEKDPNFRGPKVVTGAGQSKTSDQRKKLGNILVVKFVDRDVRLMKHELEKLSLIPDDAPIEDPAEAEAQEARRQAALTAPHVSHHFPHLIMVVGESRVFVFDYVSCTLKELDMALFDGKAPTCIETFSHENLVAFGGADGAIRLFDVITWKMEKKLTGGHNKPVVKMYSHWEDGQSFLCSASEDGLFCKWLFAGPGAVNLDSRSETKGGLQVNDITVDPVELQLIVATEKGLVVRDARKNIELARLVKNKQHILNVHYFMHPRLPRNTVLVLPKDSRQLCITNIGLEQEPTTLMSINDFPKHNEPKYRILFSALHSLHSHRIMVVTSIGIAVVNFEKQRTPNALLMPIKDQASKLFYARNGTIYSMSSVAPTGNISASPRSTGSLSSASSTPMMYAAVHKLGFNTHVELSLSPSSEFVAALFPEESKYQIISTKTWKVVEDGSASSIAWSFRKDLDTYAIIEAGSPPPTAAPTSVPADKKTSRNKSSLTTTAEKEYKRLVIHQVGSTQTRLVLDHIESTNSSTPIVFGGPLLSLTARCHIPIMVESSPNTVRFFSWSGDKLPGTMPAPVSMAWDASGKYCVIVYEESFCVFRTEPTFKLLAKVADVIISAAWHNLCLFYSSISGDIKCFFPHEYDCQDVLLSTFSNDTYDTSQWSFVGAITLLEIAGDQLVVIDSDYKLNTIRLSDPLLKFFALVHVGQVDDAAKWIPSIPVKEHSRMARFLEARGHADRVLDLRITLLEKLTILSKNSKFSECAQVLQEIIENESSVSDSTVVREAVINAGVRAAQAATKLGEIDYASRIYKQVARLEPGVLRHLIISVAASGQEEPMKDLIADLLDQGLLSEAKVAAAVSDQKVFGQILRQGKFYPEMIEYFHDDVALRKTLFQEWNAALLEDAAMLDIRMLSSDPQDLELMLDRPPSPLPLV